MKHSPIIPADDRLAKLTELLEGHRAKLQRILDLADAAEGMTGAKAFILRNNGERARWYLSAINATLKRPCLGKPYGDIGRFGPNGHGPAIDDLLSSSESFADGLVEVERLPSGAVLA